MARPKKNEKNGEKNNRGSFFDISQETKNSIWGVASVILAIVTILSFVGRAGTAGNYFSAFSYSLFGWGYFLVPLAFVMLGVAFFKSIFRQIYSIAVAGTALFVLLLGYPLLRLTGFTAALVILLALAFISVLLALDIPVTRLLGLGQKEEDEKLQDNLVIKKGMETVTQNAKPTAAAIAAQAKQAKADVSDKEFVIRNLKMGKWTLPPLEILNRDVDEAATGDINASAMIIKRTLANFSIDVEMGEVSIGPTVTQFTLRPAVGVKLSRISALNPDLSLALAAHPIRIEAPIPGKSLVGIEVPNKKVAIIGLRNMFDDEEFRKSKYFLPLALGRDVSGNPVFAGLDKMPHLLIAGATGTGKSVTINAILLSLLYRHSPDILKFIPSAWS